MLTDRLDGTLFGVSSTTSNLSVPITPTTSTTPPGAPVTGRAHGRRWWALAVLVLAVVLLSVDATVLALAVPALTTALQPSAEQLLWIGDVYSFAPPGSW